MDRAIPIFAFHRVGPRPGCRFTVPVDIFENYLRALEDEGFITLTCADLVSIAEGRTAMPARACMLTFDDGCADVWVYATPLLRRHRMRGTVFIILDRLKSNGPCRPTLDDVWSDRCRLDELYALPEFRALNTRAIDPAYFPPVDYVSLEEAQALAREGICDVQSHGLDHGVHYTSDRVTTFLAPFSHWTAVVAAHGDRRLGTPIYELNSTLAAPRYSDSLPLRDHLARVVDRSGGEAFFARTDWDGLLREELELARNQAGPGQLQSEEDWTSAIARELGQCVRTLSGSAGTRVDCLAWPFGATSPASEASAFQAGFTLAFTNQGGGFVPGMNHGRVGRIGLKDHDVTAFRDALRRYSDPEQVRIAAATTVHGRPLGAGPIKS